MRGKYNNPQSDNCMYCDSVFLKTNHRKIFCSISCREKHHRQKAKGMAGHISDMAVCKHCGKDYVYSSGGSLHCTNYCAKSHGAKNGNHKRRARIKIAPSESYYSADIIDRDGSCCSHCGTQTSRDIDFNDPLYMSFDHIIPLSKGGHDCAYNIQILCRECNTKKGNKIFDCDVKKAEALIPVGQRVEIKRKHMPAFSKRPSRRSRTGVNGVFYSESNRCYIAQIDINGKRIRRKRKSESEAIECREELEARFRNANA